MSLLDAYKTGVRPGVRIFTNAAVADLVVGPTVFMGAAYCLDTAGKHTSDEITDFVARRVIKPYLPLWEKLAKFFETHTPGDQLGMDRAKTPDETARIIADSIVGFLIPTGVSALAENMAQDRLDKVSGVQQAKATDLWIKRPMVQATAFIGSYLALTKLMPDQGEAMKSGLTKLLQRCGMQKERAEKMAHKLVWFELPSVVGSVAVALALTHTFHKNGHSK